MKRVTLTFCCLLIALAVAGAWGSKAHAGTHPTLDKIATTFAGRPTHIDCRDPELDYNLGNAWGYTYLSWDFAVMDGTLCDAIFHLIGKTPEPWDAVPPPQPPSHALRGRIKKDGVVDNEDWRAAVAVLTLVHESYHVRLWDLRGSESAVECRAIRHWTAAMGMLGVSRERTQQLLPWALASHWRIGVLAPVYASPSCKVPWPW